MDGESSYESDISESWSLIDIKTNEVTNCQIDVSSSLNESNDVQQREIEEIKLYKIKNREVSDSDSDSSSKEVGREKLDKFKSKKGSEEEEERRTDSGDTESIEILELDGIFQDSETDRVDVSWIHRFDSATYQSDDEESPGGRISTESRNNCSTVIKRKRRKISKNPNDTVQSLNGESPTLRSDCIKKADEKEITANGRPVYKHYRNNVANTVLSLSVGVIFAGVACMAIGHFLGVQEAAETSVELAETLKKLQAENAALQSRLFHLSRALLTRESNSKLELPLTPDKVPCKETQSETKNRDLNNAALSEIRSSLNSIEWLSKLQTLVHKNNKGTDPDNGMDLNMLGKYIHDQLHHLHEKKEGVKLLEDTDQKISRTLQKIISRLSSSQDKIENLYKKLMKLKDKFNHKINKIMPETKDKMTATPDISYSPPEKYYGSTERRETKFKKREKKRKVVKKKQKNKKLKVTIKDHQQPFNNSQKYSAHQGGEKKPRNFKKKISQSILAAKKNKYNWFCTGAECYNQTGYWVFRWADGREESRRHQSLGNWQFERAKARREGKYDVYEENWLLERARSRKEFRKGISKDTWQSKKSFLKGNNRNDDRWLREKRTKYNEKEFFHQGFSWI